MSTYAIYGEILFPATDSRGAIKVRRFSSVKIESSWRSLTDTAEIVLPRNIRDFNREKISEVFHEGDPVIIQYGYDGELNEEFSGYISKVPAGIPLVISCEDEMYKLKRKKASISLSNCTIKQLLQAIAPGYEVECDNSQMVGNVRFSNEPVGSILDFLKKLNINVWFLGKTLHAFATSKSDTDPVPVVLEKTVGETLKQKAIEDVLVIVKCLVRYKKKSHRYLRAKWGEETAGCKIEKTISGNITITEDDLMKEAKAIYNQKKTPGLDGDITLFGKPRMQHGMKIKLSSILYPEKNGTYYVDAVTKTLSKEGIRQICKLGDKAA